MTELEVGGGGVIIIIIISLGMEKSGRGGSQQTEDVCTASKLIQQF